MNDMLLAHERIGEKRYREVYGLAYEEFDIGDIFEHRPGRTVTEVDNIWQSLIDMNKHPAHIDQAYAQRTEFKGLLVSSSVTLSIVSGMTVSTMSARATANLAWDEIRLPNPVLVGDTLYAESEVVAKRESASRPNEGIVTIKVIGRKQDSTVVITYLRTFLVPKKAYCMKYDIK
ncbi:MULTISPECIES: MaoC family dehydratase [unclassified Undibacterium]|uniref:MaoC family dehydratase n=2 Tax=Pseudomonadota TaxID=1224 RepID=UPI002AC94022|nr:MULTISPECIES: MaoC family dehydratase [unclassified Undibacterium]MEB0140492.1 MaoC family dehydratase [Undibacterium sp. CCC2.1]MEB0174161.1 MaoC family dehydratase [Undibacterium sp. CCC1.1]MEB0178096.1 MaoC family dehydratase [Undibacterium sp. CCC3.4]MEB0217311.1 MaoC family dehydratase [Undibacterium sp. 5I2]WPX44622.1 MaoC family dehydratase [Undibacterium sp. CCC3.4]